LEPCLEQQRDFYDNDVLARILLEKFLRKFLGFLSILKILAIAVSGRSFSSPILFLTIAIAAFSLEIIQGIRDPWFQELAASVVDDQGKVVASKLYSDDFARRIAEAIIKRDPSARNQLQEAGGPQIKAGVRHILDKRIQERIQALNRLESDTADTINKLRRGLHEHKARAQSIRDDLMKSQKEKLMDFF